LEIFNEYALKYGNVIIIANKVNVGYGVAANQGMYLAKGKYIAFLNCDLYCDDRWLEPIIELFERNPRVAIVQPLILDYDQVKIQHYGFYCDIFCNPEHNKSRRTIITAPSGAAFVAKCKLFKAIGGFDPDFFMYYELNFGKFNFYLWFWTARIFKAVLICISACWKRLFLLASVSRFDGCDVADCETSELC